MSSGALAIEAPLKHSFLRFLPDAILAPFSAPRAILLGWITAFVPALLLGAAVSVLLPQLAQPEIDLPFNLLLFMVVVFAPVVETLIMGTVLLILLRLFSPPMAVAVSALGWASAHSLQAAAWGLVIWWPFLIFSTLFVAWRERSIWAAFAMPALVHALHNLPSALIIASAKP